MKPWILFDWGNTLMRDMDYPGPMYTWPEVAPLPGALETLEALKGRAHVALATNAKDSEEHEIHQALARADLDRLVERIFCFRTVGHKKSSPPFFRHVMDQLALEPGSLLMVGDDFEQDVTAANAASIQAVWFNQKDHTVRQGANHRTIHHLLELPGLLDAWGVLAAGNP